MFNKEKLEKLAEGIRETAEKALADGGAMPPIIGVWRDDVPYLWVFPASPKDGEYGRDPVLQAAWAVIVGMEPDFITLANDVFQVSQQTKLDGTEWGAGEMQYARDHNTPDAVLVHDAVHVAFFEKTGDTGSIMYEYEIKDEQLVWGEKHSFVEGEDDGHMAGVMIETLRQAFAQPSLRRMLDSQFALEKQLEDLSFVANQAMEGEPQAPSSEGLQEWAEENPKLAYAHQCCAVMKWYLLPNGHRVLLATDDEEVRDTIVESMREMPDLDVYVGESSKEVVEEWEKDRPDE